MRVINQSVEIIDLGGEPLDIYKKIERIGRVCYKSEGKIDLETYETFLKSIIRRGHESVLEHHNITLKFITDRGVTHEIVRHRIASYSQESTRYCNYTKGEMQFIQPVDFEFGPMELESLKMLEGNYNKLLAERHTPQQARALLPNCLKTEIVMTANLREWRHFFRLRTSSAAHPQMRALAKDALNKLYTELPLFFEDVLC